MKRLDIVGEKYITNEGYEVEVVSYENYYNALIMFPDGFYKKANVSCLLKGVIRNPNHKSYYNVGYLGDGNYKVANTVYGRKWMAIMKRCYNFSKNIKDKSYKNCSVDTHWHNFQNFAKWFEENYNPETMQGWHLDKDILVKGNKVYSSETCCLIPSEINMLFVNSSSSKNKNCIGVTYHSRLNKYEAALNKKSKSFYLGLFYTMEEAFDAYKTAKEAYIKEVADKWRDLIDPRVYKAMYNYKVEINLDIEK